MSAATKAREAKSRTAKSAASAVVPRSNKPRHRAIYETLLEEIRSGIYKPGERLPSEAVLCERFEASRITVAKAFENLQREQLVNRRPGSGTYVEQPVKNHALQFGLLIPELGSTEIFEPICQGLMQSDAARSHSLTWGNAVSASSTGPDAENLCRQYIAQGVAGVFFAPIEYESGRDDVNRRIADMLQTAGVAVVLLDRSFEPYPHAPSLDLVGIDNHRAGFLLTQHLVEAGAERIVFAARAGSASTVDARYAGYREAMHRLLPNAPATLISGDFDNPAEVRRMLERTRPDGVVCANDVTAARLMTTLVGLGKRIPADIRMVGVDDVSYARFLPTPLTTLRQDTTALGEVAMQLMLDRLARPDHPVMDVRLRTELVVRESCGSRAKL